MSRCGEQAIRNWRCGKDGSEFIFKQYGQGRKHWEGISAKTWKKVKDLVLQTSRGIGLARRNRQSNDTGARPDLGCSKTSKRPRLLRQREPARSKGEGRWKRGQIARGLLAPSED